MVGYVSLVLPVAAAVFATLTVRKYTLLSPDPRDRAEGALAFMSRGKAAAGAGAGRTTDEQLKLVRRMQLMILVGVCVVTPMLFFITVLKQRQYQKFHIGAALGGGTAWLLLAISVPVALLILLGFYTLLSRGLKTAAD